MNVAHPTVRLAEVLSQHREYIDAPQPRLYPKLSVRLYGKGVVLDQPVDGSTLRMKRHQLARGGQVILSEIWGKKGAIGLVPPEGAGALCTSHFFLFDVHSDLVEQGYLAWIFRSNYLEDQLSTQAFGTTGYAAVRPKDLLAATIPLPPLDEQRRIVTRIEELAAKIEEARETGRAFARDAQRLSWSFLFGEKQGSSLMPMRDALGLRSPDVEVRSDVLYRFAGVYCHGRGVFSGQCKRGSEFSYPRLTRLRRNNFVYPKLMAWEGALGVVPAECDGLVVSPEFPVFELDENKVLPEVLDTYFRTPQVWPLLSDISTGTNLRRRRLHSDAFLNLQVPLPWMEKQLRFRQMRAKLHLAEESQVQALSELDALLPSVLERAFRGDL